MATQTLPINQLHPNPFQPREKIKENDLNELVRSINSFGILEPLVVAETPAGYQIIAGERRWRAAKLARLQEVPVVIKKTSPKGMLEMALVENVQRQDLNAIERAQAFQQLMRDFKYTVVQLRDKIGKSDSYISNTLKLLTLPDAIKDGIVSKQISEGHARAISGISDEKAMIECYKIILREDASVRRAEELARQFKRSIKQKNYKSRSIAIDESFLSNWETKMQRFFQAPTELKLMRSRSQTKITITLKGSPEQTQADLEKIVNVTSKT